MGVVPMDTIIGDHRSVLNNKVRKPAKPKIVAQPMRADKVRKRSAHLSWADVVKTRPPSILRRSLAPTISC
jgi:hypothetical protein